MADMSLGTQEANMLFPQRVINRVLKKRRPVRYKGMKISWHQENGFIVTGNTKAIEDLHMRIEAITASLDFRMQIARAYSDEKPENSMGPPEGYPQGDSK